MPTNRRSAPAFDRSQHAKGSGIAEEEKKIRQDPVKAGSDIIRMVFGALK